MPNKKQNQAVVLIHGIGEQHPITTLRSFIEPLVEYLRVDKHQARPNEAVFWDKPDPESGNYETRKMVMREGQHHPTTDFYEFYWAHHMRNTNWSHISDWLGRVVFRNPARVSPRLKKVFFFLWTLILVVVCGILWKVLTNGLSTTLHKITAFTSGLIVTFVLGWFSKLLFNYLGDVARYLDPAPGNIGERQAIRSEGMALLKNLHKDGRYDRIIVVGHSLGSAIAYDLVKLLWAEYYYQVDPIKFARLAKDDPSILDFVNSSTVAAQAMQDGSGTLDEFRIAQRTSFNYLQAAGNPWRITDLVTVGCPLSYGGYLFAQEKGLFEKLKIQREYPTCPPFIQPPDKNCILTSRTVISEDGANRYRYYNHSSPFAVTRWTNIYYSSDYVGGPVKPGFGPGIRDIEKKRKSKFFAYPDGHTRYWDYDNPDHILAELWDVLEDRIV